MSGTAKNRISKSSGFRVTWAFCILAAITVATAAATLPNFFPFRNPSGVLETYSSTGSLDESGPFFQVLGTNGRSCATCHVP
jgi:cytochrome c peroxidase